MTPREFSAICEAHAENENQKERKEWERMRMLATITIQPHVKGKVTPHELLPLPWDKEETVKEQLTKEERKAQAMDALKRLG